MEVTGMGTLIAVWLAKWQAGVILRLMEVVDWLLRPAALVGRGTPAHPTTHRPGHHHTPEEHAVPGMWLMTPRVAVGLWLARAVVGLTHDVHLLGRANAAVEIHQLGRVGGR
jgi:hypothetical protein